MDNDAEGFDVVFGELPPPPPSNGLLLIGRCCSICAVNCHCYCRSSSSGCMCLDRRHCHCRHRRHCRRRHIYKDHHALRTTVSDDDVGGIHHKRTC